MPRSIATVFLLAATASGFATQGIAPGRLAEALFDNGGQTRRESLVSKLAAERRRDRWGPILLSAIDSQPSTPDQLGALEENARGSVALALAEQAVFSDDYDQADAWLRASEDDEAYSPPLRDYLRLILSHAAVDDQAARDAAKQVGESLSEFGPARRYVARVLVDEIKATKTAGERTEAVATAVREMRESGRRLQAEQLGKRLLDHQQRAIELLDQQIEELEKQQQQQQQASAAGSQGSGATPRQAAEDSRPAEGKGPGNVAPRPLAGGDPWGDLPPAERQRLTQELQRKLPVGSRDLIRAYYRSLGDGPSDEEEAE